MRNFLSDLLDDIISYHFFQSLIDGYTSAMGTDESNDQFTHAHSAHWEYLADIIPWQTRLKLSRHRGKKRALTWRIKLFSIFHGLGPKVAGWLLEEYMITTKADELPVPSVHWACPKCGAHNPDTAQFCKDCGEYK